MGFPEDEVDRAIIICGNISLQFVDLIMLWWKGALCYIWCTFFRCGCLYGCTGRFNTCITTWGTFFWLWVNKKLFCSCSLVQTHVLCISLLQFCILVIWNYKIYNIGIILFWMRVKSKHFAFHT
jgi:hypothetical protein